MKWNPAWVVVPIATAVTIAASQPAIADPADTVRKATDNFESMIRDPDTRIPASLLRQSAGIAIIPNVAQGGFIIGARHGKGVLLSRNPNGSWSNPVFLSLGGGSIGLQVGGRSSDVILVFPTRTLVDRVLTDGVEFGGSVSGVAGPVGTQPVDPIGDGFRDDRVYTYSRSGGLFGGVAIEGGDLSISHNRIEEFYGQAYSPDQILNNPTIPAPPLVEPLKAALRSAAAR
ncbi:lipid-binding SYLF domain-containing protein [Synechococcus sp. PCC 7336]|uniref:lipid-binding SYLF domain-containing protein n=1 Tax=Synechococcus sp. PCC 7336 TaxID=195250 RepID=UPI0003480530|nr:lipid-binding SYLF domain-containing protein [Synechococcus sp. PCC 7336]